METTTETALEQILRLTDERVSAIKDKDIEKATAMYAYDVRIYDVVGPLQHQGIESVKQRLQEWFSSFKGPIDYEIKDMIVEVDGQTAFCSSFNHVMATPAGGGKLDMYWRETLGWKRLDEQWLIVHAHSSVPFDPGSGKASLGLQPE